MCENSTCRSAQTSASAFFRRSRIPFSISRSSIGLGLLNPIAARRPLHRLSESDI